MNPTNKLSRRGFIGTSAAAAAAITVVPSNTIAGLGHKAPSDKLNIAGVGIGGMGFGNLKQMETENIVALCDVDWDHSQRCFEHFPKAKKYWDWRKMYDEMNKDIDAVLVATADHNHAIVGAHAMTLDKHVYIQKPLTHSVYESRLLTKLAVKHKVCGRVICANTRRRDAPRSNAASSRAGGMPRKAAVGIQIMYKTADSICTTTTPQKLPTRFRRRKITAMDTNRANLGTACAAMKENSSSWRPGNFSRAKA